MYTVIAKRTTLLIDVNVFLPFILSFGPWNWEKNDWQVTKYWVFNCNFLEKSK